MIIILTLQMYVISLEYILIRFQILTKHWLSQFIWHSLQIKCATDSKIITRKLKWLIVRNLYNNFHKTTTNDNETTICAVQNILYFNNKKT